jgi:hypothetical protein
MEMVRKCNEWEMALLYRRLMNGQLNKRTELTEVLLGCDDWVKVNKAGKSFPDTKPSIGREDELCPIYGRQMPDATNKYA